MRYYDGDEPFLRVEVPLIAPYVDEFCGYCLEKEVGSEVYTRSRDASVDLELRRGEATYFADEALTLEPGYLLGREPRGAYQRVEGRDIFGYHEVVFFHDTVFAVEYGADVEI